MLRSGWEGVREGLGAPQALECGLGRRVELPSEEGMAGVPGSGNSTRRAWKELYVCGASAPGGVGVEEREKPDPEGPRRPR